MDSTDRHHHPGSADLERFMRGELARGEVMEIVRHLLTGCPQCVAITGRFVEPKEKRRARQILKALALLSDRNRGVF